MQSVKQGEIKYHFLSLWYGSTWDWNSVSWTIGEHSTHLANSPKTESNLSIYLSKDNYGMSPYLKSAKFKRNW